jgi:hypothetical protein
MSNIDGSEESENTSYSGYYSRFGTLTREEAEEDLAEMFPNPSSEYKEDYITWMTTKPIDLTPVRKLCRLAGL